MISKEKGSLSAFSQTENTTDLLKSGKYPMLMKADRVAQHIIKALREKRRVVVIDGRYRVLVFFWRMIPR